MNTWDTTTVTIDDTTTTDNNNDRNNNNNMMIVMILAMSLITRQRDWGLKYTYRLDILQYHI